VEQTGFTIEDMRERGDAIPDPAREVVRRLAVGAKGSGPLDRTGIRSTPDELLAESDPLGWESEG
jgi:hypothetical protein